MKPIALLCLLAAVTFTALPQEGPGRFAFRVTTGASGLAGGDIPLSPDHPLDAVNLVQFEALARLLPCFEVGVGVGYTRDDSRQVSRPEAGTEDASCERSFRVRAWSLNLNAYYRLPVGKRLRFRFGGGVNGSRASLDARWSVVWPDSALAMSRFDGTGMTWGVQGSFGAEVRLHPRIRFVTDIGVRRMCFSNLQGDSTLFSRQAGGEEIRENLTNAVLWVSGNPLGGEYLVPSVGQPANREGGTVRKAVLDLSGVFLSAGLRFDF